MRNPEKFEPQLEPQSEEESGSLAEKRLKAIEQEVDEITDKLGKPIEDGIKETVVMFKAFDIRTNQSCEGHAEKDERSVPWIMVQPRTPEDEEWYKDEELREKVAAESRAMKKQLIDLLNGFYKERKIEFGNMLGFRGVGYGFKLQSNEAEIFKGFDSERAQEKLSAYRKEMQDFTEFLKKNYPDYEREKSKV